MSASVTTGRLEGNARTAVPKVNSSQAHRVCKATQHHVYIKPTRMTTLPHSRTMLHSLNNSQRYGWPMLPHCSDEFGEDLRFRIVDGHVVGSQRMMKLKSIRRLLCVLFARKLD